MNKIEAKIANITKSGSVALVKLESLLDLRESNSRDLGANLDSSANHAIFTALVLDFSDNLALGAKCSAIFKESEVMIALKDSRVSARNCFQARIANIECDEIFARIFLDFCAQTITSLITKEAKDALNLNIGDEILWFVKSNEVALEFN